MKKGKVKIESCELEMGEGLADWLGKNLGHPEACFRWTEDGLEEADPVPKHEHYVRFRIGKGEGCRLDILPCAVVLWRLGRDSKREWRDFKCWHTGKTGLKPPVGSRKLEARSAGK